MVHLPQISLWFVYIYRIVKELQSLTFLSGGARRDRTADLLRARQTLSQLSYGPNNLMVGLGGLEPPTSPLSGVRSNQLSYRPLAGKKQNNLAICVDACWWQTK